MGGNKEAQIEKKQKESEKICDLWQAKQDEILKTGYRWQIVQNQLSNEVARAEYSTSAVIGISRDKIEQKIQKTYEKETELDEKLDAGGFSDEWRYVIMKERDVWTGRRSMLMWQQDELPYWPEHITQWAADKSRCLVFENQSLARETSLLEQEQDMLGDKRDTLAREIQELQYADLDLRAGGC